MEVAPFCSCGEARVGPEGLELSFLFDLQFWAFTNILDI